MIVKFRFCSASLPQKISQTVCLNLHLKPLLGYMTSDTPCALFSKLCGKCNTAGKQHYTIQCKCKVLIVLLVTMLFTKYGPSLVDLKPPKNFMVYGGEQSKDKQVEAAR